MSEFVHVPDPDAVMPLQLVAGSGQFDFGAGIGVVARGAEVFFNSPSTATEGESTIVLVVADLDEKTFAFAVPTGRTIRILCPAGLDTLDVISAGVGVSLTLVVRAWRGQDVSTVIGGGIT